MPVGSIPRLSEVDPGSNCTFSYKSIMLMPLLAHNKEGVIDKMIMMRLQLEELDDRAECVHACVCVCVCVCVRACVRVCVRACVRGCMRA